MTSKDIRNDWAWNRVEAMADDSLVYPDRERMQLAMEQDEQLMQAVARARHVQTALRRLPRARMPAGLLGRLLAIPGRRSVSVWTALTVPVGALAAMAVMVMAVVIIGSVDREPVDPRAEAVREFTLAMTYLQRSAVVTRDEVGNQIGAGLIDAFTVSRESLAEVTLTEDDNGG